MTQTLPPVPPPAGPPPPEGHPGTGTGFGDRLAANRGVRLAVLLGALAWLAYSAIWAFVLVMALVVSIFLHEMGHYLVARRNGMKVTEFFIGFGPRIWSFRRGETEYGVKLIWLGAYVKIIGMSNLEDVDPADEPRAYRAAPFRKRVPVVLAGPVMNLALGFLLLLVVTAGFGRPSDTAWTVRSIAAGSAADRSGIQEGDRVVAFGGQPVDGFSDLVDMVQGAAGTPVELTVERDGQQVQLPVTVGWSLTADAAHRLGLRSGDTVTRVGDQAVASYPELVRALSAADGEVTVTATDGRAESTTTVQAPVELPADGSQGLLGVTRRSDVVRPAPLASVGDTASQFGEIVVGSVQGMGRLFSPAGISNLFTAVTNANQDDNGAAPVSGSGDPAPVAQSGSGGSASVSSQDAERPMSILGIVRIGNDIGDTVGWAGVLGLMAIVNIFLGLINLVPLLPLDGGHIAVACYEGVRSRIARRPYRIDMAKLMPITYVVMLFMVGLALSTIYLDAVDPITLN